MLENGSVLVYLLSQHIPFPGPRMFLCSTLYLQSSIWSPEQLSVELLMRKGIEELAAPQEQLLEVHGWLGPDAWDGGEPTEINQNIYQREDGKEGQFWLLWAVPA